VDKETLDDLVVTIYDVDRFSSGESIDIIIPPQRTVVQWR
jgi:hypothetical protein